MARVVVYKNLRRGDWSIAALSGNRGRGKVIDHVRSCILANATFVVQEGSRQAVIRNRERSVHAWVIGDLVASGPAPEAWQSITYNPYLAPTFRIRGTDTAVHTAAYAIFTPEKGAYIA